MSGYRAVFFKRFFLPRCLLFFSTLFLSIIQFASGIGVANPNPAVDFTDMSIEELLDVVVVSASKKVQKLFETDAAVYVISQEDLKRSGATNIPDALRMVPGLQVARIDANKWAISARGFNGRFANKLLVLIDGRSVYTPLFSGVYWDNQDTLIEDIERIEVIRGPGATLWGANAVNGVINIITKNTRDTQGSLVTAGTGTEERGFGSVRYGGKAGKDAYYRIYAKYFDRDGGKDIAGNSGGDAWNAFRAGFRMDWCEEVTLQGELFSGNAGSKVILPTLSPPYTQVQNEQIDTGGGHLLGQWEHRVSDASRLSFQFYYDRNSVDQYYADTTVDTMDAEFNHQYRTGTHNELMWGLGYRFTADEIFSKTWVFAIRPKTGEYHLLSGFVQDELNLMADKLRLTVGSKFEHNDYTGFEVQPSVRLLWTPETAYSLWTSVSRAVRTPSRAETSFQYTLATIPPGTFKPSFPGTGIAQVVGNKDLDAEDLYAFELGCRTHPAEKISFDFATFYNIYENLLNGRAGQPYIDMTGGAPLMIVPATTNNGMNGKSFGAELAVDWFVSADWKLKLAYSYLMLRLDNKNSNEKLPEEGNNPYHQLSVRSAMNFPGNLFLDLWGRYVDSIGFKGVDSYITADVRLGWHLTEKLEVSITGQNLLEPSHPEYGPEQIVTLQTEAERSVYGKLLWHF